MSKEQKCKCCQDYWYISNLTNGLCPNCYDYVADLEAKLSEYEKELMDNEKCFTEKDVEGLIKDREQTIKFLKQQLAEKDEENLILFSMLYETLEKQGYENITSTIEQMTNLTLEKQSNWLKENCVKNQDKISFCVEQLAEIREYVKECWGLDELEGKVRLDIAKKIRLKIEQLKGKK